MFQEIKKINARPELFGLYTADDLWTGEHTSQQMLAFHLKGDVDISSRNTAFIERSVAWIVSRFNIGAGTQIADFGCGPGLYAIRLAQKHADVTGIDFSPRSIRYAQEVALHEGLPIRYVNQNYLDFMTEERFHLILMIMCDFCALIPSQRKMMLQKFHAILEPDGAVLLDVYSLKAFAQREETALYEANLLNGFWSPNEYYGFLNTFKYDNENVILDKYTIVEAGGNRSIYNWLQYFSPEALERELTECGFSVEDFYADVAGSPYDPQKGEFAVVGRKNDNP